MLNLLSNAIKFTFEGYIKIDGHEFHDVVTGNRYISVSVQDTGLGIKEEDIPRLFNIFSKLETHHSVNKTGAGLGLTISNALCSKLGGKIKVASVYGKGSTFEFLIKDEPYKRQESFKMDMKLLGKPSSYKADLEFEERKIEI